MNNNLEFENEDPEPNEISPRTNYGEGWKQETLEEAIEREYPISKGGSMWMPSAEDCNNANKQDGFIRGTKWQSERSYSEEDLRDAFREGVDARYETIENHTFQEKEDMFIEKFKKK